mmetsp:Transcript_14109/g.26433  ORF Transcript_14109/g.26433 Transcript_14109/m.26433 type:complete len:232 (-) Transcript_14109:465-1160(-)
MSRRIRRHPRLRRRRQSLRRQHRLRMHLGRKFRLLRRLRTHRRGRPPRMEQNRTVRRIPPSHRGSHLRCRRSRMSTGIRRGNAVRRRRQGRRRRSRRLSMRPTPRGALSASHSRSVVARRRRRLDPTRSLHRHPRPHRVSRPRSRFSGMSRRLQSRDSLRQGRQSRCRRIQGVHVQTQLLCGPLQRRTEVRAGYGTLFRRGLGVVGKLRRHPRSDGGADRRFGGSGMSRGV